MTSTRVLLLALAATSAGCLWQSEAPPEESVEANVTNDTPDVTPPATTPAPEESVSEPVTPSGERTPTPPAEPTTPTPPPATLPSPPPPDATPTPAPSPSPSPTPSPAPSPAPTPQPTTWPHEGSYVTYRIDSGSSVPDGSGFERVFANASWTFTQGDWHGTCDAHVISWYEFHEPQWNNSTYHVVYDAAHPPHWPLFDTTTPPAVGATVTGWYLQGCGIESNTYDFVFRGSDALSVPGHAGPLATYNATSPDDGVPRDHRTQWLQGSGLVVYALMQWHYSHAWTELTGTDAPR